MAALSNLMAGRGGQAADAIQRPGGGAQRNRLSVAYCLILDARKSLDAAPLTVRHAEHRNPAGAPAARAR